MAKKLYSWWSKYMFWKSTSGWPFGFPIVDPIPTITKLISGHRGNPDHAPENTFASFDSAISEGAGAIETDVWITSDDEFVCIHDSTVDRTTDGSGSVDSFTLNEIQQLDAGSWFDSEFSGEKIPSLDDFLEEYKGQDLFLILHIKLSLSYMVTIKNIVESKGMSDQCIFFGDRDDINALKNSFPTLFCMNDGTGHSAENIVQNAIDNGRDAASTSPNSWSESDVELAHVNQVYCQASYLSGNYANNTQGLIDLGVDFILGDDVGAMVAIADQNSITQVTPDTIERYKL